MQTVLKDQISSFRTEIKQVIKKILDILSGASVFDISRLNEIENLLLHVSYKAAVLSLPEISVIVNPCSYYVRELKSSEKTITGESLKFVKQVLRTLYSLAGTIEMPDENGVYIDSSAVLVNSFFKNPPDTEDLLKAYRKRQININKINKI